MHEHEMVDVVLAVGSVAAILLGSIIPYLLARVDRRLEALESKLEASEEKFAHLAGFCKGKCGYVSYDGQESGD